MKQGRAGSKARSSTAACSATATIRFLNAIEADAPAGKVVHVILDNYGAYKHPKVMQWLGRHPRFTFHFTPTSCSWINAGEGFFATLTAQAETRRLPIDVVDKVRDEQRAGNNRIQVRRFLNQCCAPDSYLDSMLLTRPSKYVFRQHRTITDLQAAINRYLVEHNENPKPFVWKDEPSRVLAAIERGKQALESVH